MKLSQLKQLIYEEVESVLENEFESAIDPNMFDDVPTVNMYIDDSDGQDKMFIDISAMYHSGDNGKVAVLKKNPELRQQIVATLQKEIQALFRNTIHSLAGEPFGLKEKQDIMKLSELKQIIRQEIQTVLVEAKKAKKKAKLDPVGKEDDDVDNDGKSNTKSDKYLLNRRKTIGKNIAKSKK